MKKILLTFVIMGTLFLNAQGSCQTKKLKTNSQFHKAQVCLKKAIRNSIYISKQYKRRVEKEKREIRKYKDKRALCRKYQIQNRDKSFMTCKVKLKRMRNTFRNAEEEARFLEKQFVKFRQQIRDLKSKLYLLEMDYNSRR